MRVVVLFALGAAAVVLVLGGLIPSAGPQLLAAVTAWCADRAVMPSDLQVGRRTLEDVFLDLTGRELR